MLRNDWFPAEAVLNLTWTAAWQIAAVAVVVAVVTAVVCRRRPHLAYLLWLLVLVKAVTPPLWSSPTSAFSWALARQSLAPAVSLATPPALPPANITFNQAPQAEVAPAAPIVTDPIVTDPIVPEPPAGEAAALPMRTSSVSEALLAAWAIGAASLGVWLTINWLRLARRIQRTTAAPDAPLAEKFADIKHRIGLRRAVRLRISSEPLGPAALGWWRGSVLVPRSVVEQSSASELEAILAHELVHLRRFDPLVGSLQLAVQCLWWWHPAVWWANRQVRIERERSCDEAVLAQVDVRPADYARLLVELLDRSRAPVPAMFWSGMRSTSATTARVRHVLETKTFRHRSPLAAWLIAALAIVIVLPGAGSRLITAAPPEPAQQAQPEVATPAVPPTAGATGLSTLWKQNRVFGTLTDDEKACILELEKLGVECFWVDSAPDPTWYGTTGHGQLWFDPPLIPQGKSKTVVQIYLPPSLVPAKPLPLDRLPSLLTVQVGGGRFFTPANPAWEFQAPPTEALLRGQLKSLVALPSSATLNVTYNQGNANALQALTELPHLERLALWPNFASTAADKPQFHVDALLLRAFAWSSDSLKYTNLDHAISEIAKIRTLEKLMLFGTMDADALNQLSTLSKLRVLHATRQWTMGDEPPPLNLTCLAGMPELEDLSVDLIDDQATSRIGQLAKLRSLWTMPAEVSDAGLRQLVKASQLRWLHLSGSPRGIKLTSHGLASLGALANLEKLELVQWNMDPARPQRVTDEAFAGWASLTKLESLDVSAAEIGDASLRVLGGLPALRTIQLHGKLNVTDDGIALLAGLSKLQMLILPDSRVTGPGLSALAAMNRLQTLSLARAPLEDSGMVQLAKINSLQQLDISHAKITDGGLADLAGKLPQLTRMNLANTNITDAGAAALLNRPKLQELDVTGTNLTVRFLNQLSEGNGMLKVWSQPASRGAMGGMNSGEFQPVEWRHVPPTD